MLFEDTFQAQTGRNPRSVSHGSTYTRFLDHIRWIRDVASLSLSTEVLASMYHRGAYRYQTPPEAGAAQIRVVPKHPTPPANQAFLATTCADALQNDSREPRTCANSRSTGTHSKSWFRDHSLDQPFPGPAASRAGISRSIHEKKQPQKSRSDSTRFDQGVAALSTSQTSVGQSRVVVPRQESRVPQDECTYSVNQNDTR